MKKKSKKLKKIKLPKNWGKMVDRLVERSPMSAFGDPVKTDLRRAYEMVIKDLSGGTKCRKHESGCFQCDMLRLAESLSLVLEMGFDDEK